MVVIIRDNEETTWKKARVFARICQSNDTKFVFPRMVAETLTEIAAVTLGGMGSAPRWVVFPLFKSFVVQKIKKGEILRTGISPPFFLPDVSKNKTGVRVYAVVVVVVDCLVGSCF